MINDETGTTIVSLGTLGMDIKKGTNLIFYMSNSLKIERFYKETLKLKNLMKCRVNIKANCDLIIKGLGFIKFTNDSDIILYLDKEIKYGVRKSLI